METRVLTHHNYGSPSDVMVLESYALDELSPGQVLVKSLFSAINPADINMMEGVYSTRPELPYVLGNEGVGEVQDVGKGVQTLSKGDRVIMPFKSQAHWVGSWSEYFVSDERDLIIVPDHISSRQAAMMSVNPLTAWRLIQDYESLDAGDWIVQNAATSSVGLWINYFAQQMGVSVLNIVRREEDRLFLADLGFKESLVYEKGLSKTSHHATDVRVVFNAVGGESAKELIRFLGDYGTCVTYGAMSKEPVVVGNGDLIFKNVVLTGFHRTRWIDETPAEMVRFAYNEIFDLLKENPFEAPVAAVYPLDRAIDAISHAQRSSRQGKVLFTFLPE